MKNKIENNTRDFTYKKIMTLIGYCLMSIGGLYAQGRYGHVAPEVADFIRYGETPVSLFTGKMNLSVPLYRYKDTDFDIPLSLTYSSDGFKPGKRSNFVGLDWFLSAGGCITREVYGSPDENYPESGEEEWGYWQVLKASQTYQNKDAVWNFNSSLVQTESNPLRYIIKRHNGYYVEYQPDLFSFHFTGHSGQFMIANSTSGKSNLKGYKIDVSGMKDRKRGAIMPDTLSTLKIITPDGYLYEFGGNRNALEFSVPFVDNDEWNFYSEKPIPTILSWHLTKITAPNGRTAIFNYVNSSGSSLQGQLALDPLWQSGNVEFSAGNSATGIVTKNVVLSSMEIDNVKIEFHKSREKTLEEYSGECFWGHLNFNSAVYQLDSIRVLLDNIVKYRYTLTYQNHRKRRFLQTVKLPDNGQYGFEYNHTTYPINPSVPNTSDVYGYWGSGGSSQDISAGMMTRINYPTGGYSTFEYEKHNHRREVQVQMPNLNKSLIIPDSSLKVNVRSARIRKITHYTSQNEMANFKEYIYNSTLTGNESSGIFYQCLPYIITSLGQKVFLGIGIAQNYNVSGDLLGYSTVFEKYPDGSYQKYVFTDYVSNPDNNALINIQFINNSSYDPLSITASMVDKTVSQSSRYGHLSEKITYNPQHTEISRETYAYYKVGSFNMAIPAPSQDEVDNDPYFVYFRTLSSVNMAGGLTKKVYLRSHPKYYENITADGVSKTNIYQYNTYDLLQTQSSITSATDTLKTKYTYPFDYTSTPYPAMVTKNILSPVVETSIFKNASLIEKTGSDYALQHNKFYAPVNMKYQKGSESMEVRETYLYDTMGNMKEIIKNDADKVTYLWGYNYQYPIAEIKNASYSQIEQALTSQLINRVTSAATPAASDLTAIKNLRTNANLSGAMVTVYEYRPLVGMTNVIDPRGVVTHYMYDSFGRLKRTYLTIENDIGKPIQEYDYHYKNQ